METYVLDVRRGECSNENLKALVDRGFEIVSASNDVVVFRTGGIRLRPVVPETPNSVRQPVTDAVDVLLER